MKGIARDNTTNRRGRVNKFSTLDILNHERNTKKKKRKKEEQKKERKKT